MKKVIAIVLIIITLLILSTCHTKHISYKQSEQNFIKYEQEILLLADKYGLYVEKNPKDEYNYIYVDSPKEDNIIDYSVKFKITLNDEEQIIAYFSNWYEETQKKDFGSEHFCIEYTKKSIEKQFDLELFIELANIFSGKKINIKLCNDLLSNEWSTEELHEFSYPKASRHHFLDFWENWDIYYALYSETGSSPEKEVLSFGGLTKQSTQNSNAIILIIIWITVIIILSFFICYHKRQNRHTAMGIP